jgi:hypothetical protein
VSSIHRIAALFSEINNLHYIINSTGGHKSLTPTKTTFFFWGYFLAVTALAGSLGG